MFKQISLFFFFCAALGFANTEGERSPRFFTHILDYIAVDYPGAVQNGKVVSPNEYAEQLEFVKTVRTLGKEFPELQNDALLQGELVSLEKLILAKAPSENVSALARKISSQAVALCKIQNFPKRWPNLHKGKSLYEQNCAQCHGQTGKGDGPSGGQLDPKPTDFHGEKVEGLPPFQAFNAIRLGVPGTAMAGFTNFSDTETWDLAFFVLSLRHGNTQGKTPKNFTGDSSLLVNVATKSDSALKEELSGSIEEKKSKISELRLMTNDSTGELQTLDLAQENLKKSVEYYRVQNYSEARTSAIVAYLDGIEPVEPRLRAKDFSFTQVLETQFAEVRSAIETRVAFDLFQQKVNEAIQGCERARELLRREEGSAALTFSVAAGIFIREGFEAALILITLLGIVRSVGAPRAALSIHLGWISALVFGVVLWFFSGWILNMSGAQRELIEGVVSGLAVLVLLYFGFWLHRKTEIGRWRIFINEMTRRAVSTKSLFALGSVAFMGVFRECFETVLFLRALLIEAGPKQHWAMGLGVLSSFLVVLFFSYGLIRQSAKLPVRKLFQISSVILVILSLILVGKMMHSFQETGIVGITPIPFPFRADLFGIFPTVETLVTQVVLLVAIFLVVFLGNQISTKENAVNS